MARSNTPTWVPLDLWAQTFGINRWEFNGFAKVPSTVGGACENVWRQFPEQYDTPSREEVGDAIAEAERVISEFLGFNLLPDWRDDEVYPQRYFQPEKQSARSISGYPKSVQVPRGYIHQLGVRVSTFLENVATTLVDKDGDGFAETIQVTITDWGVNLDQLHLYFSGNNGDPAWEIKPIKFVDHTTVEFPAYLGGKPELTDSMSFQPLDPRDSANFIETVDVYQVYNDPTTPITLYFNDSGCEGVAEYTIASVGYPYDEKLGFIVYNPSMYNLYGYYDPRKIRVRYMSGWQKNNSPRSLVEIDPIWVKPVVYLSVAFMETYPRDCNGNPYRFTEWAEDLTKIDRNEGKSYMVSDFQINNPLGVTTKGAWYAYQRIARLKL